MPNGTQTTASPVKPQMPEKPTTVDPNAWRKFAQQLEAYKAQVKEWEAANRKWQQQKEMGQQLSQLTGFQEEAFDRLTRGFRTATETAVGQQLGGVLRGVGQTAARRGIVGSGIMAGAETQARGQLAGQALQAQLGYRQRLSELHEQARQGFILGKFDFFEAMDMQINQQEFAERMAQLQRKWQLDDQARQQMWDFAQGLGGFAIDFATGRGWI